MRKLETNNKDAKLDPQEDKYDGELGVNDIDSKLNPHGELNGKEIKPDPARTSEEGENLDPARTGEEEEKLDPHDDGELEANDNGEEAKQQSISKNIMQKLYRETFIYRETFKSRSRRGPHERNRADPEAGPRLSQSKVHGKSPRGGRNTTPLAAAKDRMEHKSIMRHESKLGVCAKRSKSKSQETELHNQSETKNGTRKPESKNGTPQPIRNENGPETR